MCHICTVKSYHGMLRRKKELQIEKMCTCVMFCSLSVIESSRASFPRFPVLLNQDEPKNVALKFPAILT